MKSTFLASGLLLLTAAAGAQTLSVTKDTVSYSGGVYSYDYVFQYNNAGGATPLTISNIYLSSGDLSPADLNYSQNGATTADWSYSTVANYLVFQDSVGGLGNGDTLEVTFDDSASSYVPTANSVAIAADASFSNFTPYVSGLVGPTAVPEPGAVAMISGLLVSATGLLHLRRRAR